MKKTTIGILGLLVVGLLATTAFALPFGKMDQKARNEIKEAIENNNYEAWKEAAINQLTEENFNKIVEFHKKHQEKRENMEAVKDALDNEDYDAWKAAIEQTPFAEKIFEKISEDNFPTLVKLHNARMEGDHETAKELAKELEIRGPLVKAKLGRGRGHMGPEAGPMI